MSNDSSVLYGTDRKTYGKRGLAVARRAVDAARVVTELGEHAPDERQLAILQDFPGWGPAAALFDPELSGKWAELADEFDEIAGNDGTRAGRIVDTSFYTPPALITHIYGVLRTAGFAGGSVLDLGCGSGRFATHAPDDMPIRLTGIEADPIAAAIARALNPAASIITGELQSITLPASRFDAAVGNVPFSSSNVYDSTTGYYGDLHNYFVTRAVAAVRPGGYVVLVTSRHTLDAVEGLDKAISRHADLLGAVRLPTGYFRADGTDVVADVVVLRVRGEDDPKFGWHQAGPATTDLGDVDQAAIVRGGRVRVSRFWVEHPECVAGRMKMTGFDRNPVAVEALKPAEAVAAAFAALTPLLVPYPPVSPVPADLADVRLTDVEGRKEGSLHIVDSAVVRVVDGALTPVARAGAELRALIGLRDAAVALVESEANWECPDGQIEPLRTACREAYTAYVERFGLLNRGVVTEGEPDPETGTPKLGWRTATLGGFRKDPDAPVVLALEVFDQEAGHGTPAPILTRRVNKRPKPVTRAATAGEALSISLGEGRGLDLHRIAGLLGLADQDAAFDALGDLAYRNPGNGQPVAARDYLSGNVRVKLRAALAAAAMDPSYERNVTALEQVQPPMLGRHDIRIELGSVWVTAGDVADFCEEVFGRRATVNHIAPLASWEVDGWSQGLSGAARLAYCTSRMDAFALLQVGLNGSAPIVYDEVWDAVSHTYRKVRNGDQTEAAEQKLQAIAERFSVWVWENPERERRIVEHYNETMNAHVLRRHDGTHLTFPGLADGVELWSWQRDFVDQGVSMPQAFNAFEVGLGKTLTAITLAMTLRQFGLANRVALSVPLHLIEQFTREAYQAWPSGRFLIVTRDDLKAGARRRFAARCAMGDWDMVIMTHEIFSAIPVPASVEERMINDELSDLEAFSRAGGYKGKRIASAVRSLQGRLEKLRDNINDPHMLTWDMLGIDYLVVDEADRYRRLYVPTRADGFSLGSAKRAKDLQLKIEMLRQSNPDRPHVTLMTGTPFTNTLAEAFVWTKMLAPEQLRRTGLEHFDSWAAQFIRYEVIVEVSPDGGGFRSRRRPSVIQNVPELRMMLGEFMTIVRAQDTDLQRPDAVRDSVVVPASADTHAYMQTLVKRADDLRARRISAEKDNMLVICSDGRKVALDPHLVGISGGAPKLEAVAERVAEIYRQTREVTYPGSEVPGAFQLVLCDLGTPNTGDNQSYGRIRAGLIARGVPAAKIRFVHEAATTKSREAIFAGCRDGSIAILLGSTPKVGIGTNIQKRMTAIHHVDPTWTAAAWEQRNGRGIRKGNYNAQVSVISYICEGTFDAFMFGILERKSRGFEQLYRNDGLAREIEDMGDVTLNFGELKAAAAGNVLLLRQHELTTQIRKLRLEHVTAMQNVRTLSAIAVQTEDHADALMKRTQLLERFGERVSTLGPVDLARTALAVCDEVPQRFWDADWKDQDVMVGFRSNDAGHHLVVRYDHEPLWSVMMPAKVRRRGAAAVQEWAEHRVESWIGELDAEIAQTNMRAEETRCRAEDARGAAAAADLAEPAALIAARAELDGVNSRINDELVADDPAAAA
ncbi:methyltransferase type 11 [Mycobacterium sp. CBMA 213]|uniref:Helicase ATP-binding domain-containing protein n=1 Tax=Mycolicibacterium sp. CBMA 213 TaxID=1968788 RepID=A0A343VRU4_9MYCO|nr:MULTISPECIES: methyltransferase domain-containing protein [unclassified Mycolicibacterium]AVN58618.1 hypothetical protein B5P44_p00356 [Mycolicibacterium sp. CBMA 213]MUL61254.1 methyltransferase domain-containing protein [Mycolicibacterium sp. CBMA 335]MUM03491.1 methyltransferase type 11 [Mycolicibacterium sp. CBMA 213]